MPRPHHSHAAHRSRPSSGEITIPDKLYFRIGEVSELTAVKSYVLRYWESEFPMLKPVKNKAGRRLFRRQDLETVIEIKKLLYEKGYTIDGARKHIAGASGGDADKDLESATTQRPSSGATRVGQNLHAIKRELQGILTILSTKC